MLWCEFYSRNFFTRISARLDRCPVVVASRVSRLTSSWFLLGLGLKCKVLTFLSLLSMIEILRRCCNFVSIIADTCWGEFWRLKGERLLARVVFEFMGTWVFNLLTWILTFAATVALHRPGLNSVVTFEANFSLIVAIRWAFTLFPFLRCMCFVAMTTKYWVFLFICVAWLGWPLSGSEVSLATLLGFQHCWDVNCNTRSTNQRVWL